MRAKVKGVFKKDIFICENLPKIIKIFFPKFPRYFLQSCKSEENEQFRKKNYLFEWPVFFKSIRSSKYCGSSTKTLV